MLSGARSSRNSGAPSRSPLRAQTRHSSTAGTNIARSRPQVRLGSIPCITDAGRAWATVLLQLFSL
eukprot:932888-Pyramimonas_sp.AAC.1